MQLVATPDLDDICILDKKELVNDIVRTVIHVFPPKKVLQLGNVIPRPCNVYTTSTFDAILDVGSSISMIDVKVCETLGLPMNPFSCDISHCVGIEGASMVKSLILVLGWIEVELGILGLGCILARFWVTDCNWCLSGFREQSNQEGLWSG